MRIILIGQAAFAEKTLDKLVSKGEEVLAVFCFPDAPGGRIDPVKQRALQLGIPVRQHKTLKTPEVTEQFVSLKADLAILAFVSQIIPPPVFNAPRLGSICYHPSLLPKYRGRTAINWALIRGETATGLTIFWLDKGIDTGPILLQKEVQVEPDDTTGTLYFNKLFPMGIEAIGEAVDLIKVGNPPRIAQDESKATYDPPCRDEHAKIDWTKPAKEVYNLIRGCDPQPGAHTIWQGKMVRIFDARLRSGANTASAGQVTAIGAENIAIALNGGALTVKRLRGEGAKISGAEFAKQVDLKVGDRLG
ncbi:MAG: methionyl-tRNA formyltransferase [Candidatus Binatia bacterium]